MKIVFLNKYRVPTTLGLNYSKHFIANNNQNKNNNKSSWLNSDSLGTVPLKFHYFTLELLTGSLKVQPKVHGLHRALDPVFSKHHQ